MGNESRPDQPAAQGPPAWLNPVTLTRGFVALAVVVTVGTLATTSGGAIALLPLLLAPLAGLYWVSVRVRGSAAAGWLVFGGGFVIVAPVLLFLLALSVESINPTDGQGAVGFGLMLLGAPILQLLGIAILYVLATLAIEKPTPDR